MAKPLKLLVLTHKHDDFSQDGYLLARLRKDWQSEGWGPEPLHVEVQQGPTETPPPADIAFLHTNITQVEPAYREFIAHYPTTINGAVTDISKRHISGLIVEDINAFNGPVIVKTDANFGGRPEWHHEVHDKGLDPTARHSWATARTLRDYPVFRTPGKVPQGVWENPRLVVEKFLPERTAQGHYVLRVWLFLGDQSLHYRCLSNKWIIKSNNTLKREPLDVDAVPETLRRRRAELGFDYGKFDYVMVDGQAILLDANRTPGLGGTFEETQDVASRLRSFSYGLEGFLKKAKGGS